MEKDKPILVDFWEVWCGPCIKSLSEVEKLKVKFGEKIDIVGIVSENPEKAKILASSKNLTFTNLIGNQDINEAYDIVGILRYFLIDATGTIRKEYFGFSPQIEMDILDLIQ